MVRGPLAFRKNLFIDSSLTGSQAQLQFPQGVLSSEKPKDRFSVSLQQFSLRNTLQNVNEGCNTFYIKTIKRSDNTSSFYPVSIPNLNYNRIHSLNQTTFADDEEDNGSLVYNINYAIGQTIESNDDLKAIIVPTSVKVSYNELYDEKLIIDFNTANNDYIVQIISFKIKGAIPPGVSIKGSYQNTHILLGARPVTSSEDTKGSMDNVATVENEYKFKSYIRPSLQTITALYLHLQQFATNSYASTSIIKEAADSNEAVQTTILARIPINDLSVDVIHWEETAEDTFQILSKTSHCDTLNFYITDESGLLLSSLDPTVSTKYLLNWQAYLRFDMFPSADPIQNNTSGMSVSSEILQPSMLSVQCPDKIKF